MESTAALLQRVEAYCTEHGIAESTLGRLAVNDGKLVSRLRAGKDVTVSVFERLSTYMETPPPIQGRSGPRAEAEAPEAAE